MVKAHMVGSTENDFSGCCKATEAVAIEANSAICIGILGPSMFNLDRGFKATMDVPKKESDLIKVTAFMMDYTILTNNKIEVILDFFKSKALQIIVFYYRKSYIKK
jgi:hypothetical protein